MDMQFWRSRRVLITGHTGFKGSWLSLWLQRMGATVIGFAQRPPTEPGLFDAAEIASGMESITGDVRDAETLQRVIAQHRPEVVFHLAAQPIVRTSYLQPLETLSTNVMGTANLLEAVRKADSVRVALCITSDKCYLNQGWHWGYREDERLGGQDPYSGSKACAEGDPEVGRGLVQGIVSQREFAGCDNAADSPVRNTHLTVELETIRH